MANDLAKDGILLNAVVPSSTLTERLEEAIRKTAAETGKSEAEVLRERGARFPLGRLAAPQEVAAVVAFLASERASYVLGCAWQVDGGAMAAI
jgi:NAD(P)-dependent dehydrogenase (short-subunit alcohol dehydrogenase family)